MIDDSFVDLENSGSSKGCLQKLSSRITLGGQQEFPRGFLPSDVLPWSPSGDLAADGHGSSMLWPMPNCAKREDRHAAKHRSAAFACASILPLSNCTRCRGIAARWHGLLSRARGLRLSRVTCLSRCRGQRIDHHPIKVLIVISNPNDLHSKYDLPQSGCDSGGEVLQGALVAINSERAD
jgi:hypothetical protein